MNRSVLAVDLVNLALLADRRTRASAVDRTMSRMEPRRVQVLLTLDIDITDPVEVAALEVGMLPDGATGSAEPWAGGGPDAAVAIVTMHAMEAISERLHGMPGVNYRSCTGVER
jgi:hypothetical protein